jgi:SRSO17 transposase
MDQQATQQPLTGEARLAAYLDAITGGLGHTSRAASAQTYCTGLLLPGERKSIEPMAARLDPAHVQAKHQSLHHVVAEAEWDDAALLAAVRAEVLPAIERHGPVCYWIFDDSRFPKQGTHSVPEPRVFSDGEAAVTQDTSMGSIKGWTIPLMVGQPGRDRPWTKSCVWSGSTV